jgi:hypothetical protein
MSKKLIHPSERDFQTWFKSNWSGWLTQLHPGQGSDTGIPDLLLGCSLGILPAEVKIGSVDEEGVVWCSAVRPAQISWHTRLNNRGFNSILLIGCWQDGKWNTFAIDSINAKYWDVCGFKIGECAFEIDPANLFDSLNDFLFDQIEN